MICLFVRLVVCWFVCYGLCIVVITICLGLVCLGGFCWLCCWLCCWWCGCWIACLVVIYYVITFCYGWADVVFWVGF